MRCALNIDTRARATAASTAGGFWTLMKACERMEIDTRKTRIAIRNRDAAALRRAILDYVNFGG